MVCLFQASTGTTVLAECERQRERAPASRVVSLNLQDCCMDSKSTSSLSMQAITCNPTGWRTLALALGLVLNPDLLECWANFLHQAATWLPGAIVTWQKVAESDQARLFLDFLLQCQCCGASCRI